MQENDKLVPLLPKSMRGHPLVEQALTHISSGRAHNERLEFLGDAVIGLVVADWLYRNRPDEDEGGLSRLRSALVSRRGLAGAARDAAIGEHLQLSQRAAESGEAGNDRILSSAVEALTGAVFSVEGWDAAVTFTERLLDSGYQGLPECSEDAKDAKTRLQERQQAQGKPRPAYRIAASPGNGQTEFIVVCVADARAGSGSGSTRQMAEQAAASALLDDLESGGHEGHERVRHQRQDLHSSASALGSA